MTSIRDLQTRLGVTADGIVGRATLSAIYKALGWPVELPPKKTVADFISGFIANHEGGLSTDPADNGNWTGGRRGVGQLVGSKFGVTAGALAAFRGVPASAITARDIAGLSLGEAVAIGVKLYYQQPGFDRLPFNRVTLSLIDKGWGSGPQQAIKLMQRMVGTVADGIIGPATIAAYTEWLAKHGEEKAAELWADVRVRFDTSLNQPRFINGWNSRTRSFLPGTAWWREWAP